MLVKELSVYRDIKTVLYFSKDTFKIRKYQSSFKVKRKGFELYERPISNQFKSLTYNLSKIVNKKFKQQRIDSIYRSKRNITDIIDNNFSDFKTFITLTFSEDIRCPKIAYSKYKVFYNQWQRLLSKQGRQLKVLGVVEFQKTGRIHYHLLTNLVNGVDIVSKPKKLIRSKCKSKWREFYDIKFWSYGYSTSDTIDFINDKQHLTNYLLKYLVKDFKINTNIYYRYNRYIATRNFERTKKIYVDDIYSQDDIFNLAYNFIDLNYNTYNEYSYKLDTFSRALIYNEKQFEIKQSFGLDYVKLLYERLLLLSKAVRLT